jgi:hypothetical protein
MKATQMKDEKFNKLPLGLYRIHWKDGGTSVAAIGQDDVGNHWIAPANWTDKTDETGFVRVSVINKASWIKKVELITIE